MSARNHAAIAMKNQRPKNVMNITDKEQLIIAVSSTATKVSGTATTATSAVGFWAFLINHQQPILIMCAILGAIITLITATINARFQHKRDVREERDHLKQIAIHDYRLDQMKLEAEKRRRADDDHG